jgi:hypothetical protein
VVVDYYYKHCDDLSLVISDLEILFVVNWSEGHVHQG